MTTSSLTTVLKSNAIFSAASGLLMLIFSGDLSTLFASPVAWLVPAIGAGLLVFSLHILVALRSGGPGKLGLWYFSVCDFGWVAGSVGLIALKLVSAPLAVALLLGAAAIVLLFATLQLQHRQEAGV